MIAEVLAERIVQLDNLYCIARDLRFKALILSQILHLAQAIDPDFLIEERVKTSEGELKGFEIVKCILKLAYAVDKAYYENDQLHWAFKNLAQVVTLMDRLRTKVLVRLIELGLLKRFKELPIAIAEDKEAGKLYE